MSPRRSSRASRSTQPPLTEHHQPNSSASSDISGRTKSSAGPEEKTLLQRSSVAARSQSSEDIDSAAKTPARRTRSSQEEVKSEVSNKIEQALDIEEEEEVTRCICRNLEYPGLPVTTAEGTKVGLKANSGTAVFNEDTTGWFIQCDGCKVWQHGGCVGIMDENICPEEYYCEQCRKDLHKITTMANGRTYSLYLPTQEKDSPQSSPAPAPKKNPKREPDSKEAQQKAEIILKGRRSTMNSRDAAYEEEQLRIAIEESKREGRAESTVTGTRKAKRSRSESGDRDHDAKRQRTTSGSASSASQGNPRRPQANPDNDDDDHDVRKVEKPKNIRGAAARNHKNKEARELEAKREKERAESRRRTGRTVRDKESRSATPEPPHRNAPSRSAKPPATSFPPPALPDRPVQKQSHKKTGRPPARKGRVGRNQYTKDRDTHTQAAHAKSSPAPSSSSQNADGGTPHANGGINGNTDNTGGVGKPSRPRHLNPKRASMNDMKRRVAGILEFISHTQVEMAGSGTIATTKSSTSSNTPPDSNNSNHAQNGSNGRMELSDKAINAALLDLDAIDEQAFGGLSSLEMMEVLTRNLMRWQGQYGKWGDK